MLQISFGDTLKPEYLYINTYFEYIENDCWHLCLECSFEIILALMNYFLKLLKGYDFTVKFLKIKILHKY